MIASGNGQWSMIISGGGTQWSIIVNGGRGAWQQKVVIDND